MPSKQDCVNAVMRGGVDSKAARAIVDDMLKHKKKLAAEGVLDRMNGRMAERIMKEAESARMKAILEKKHAAAQIVAVNDLMDRIGAAEAEGFTIADALEADMVGSSKRFSGSRDSVTKKRAGIINSWIGGLQKELTDVGSIPHLRQDPGFSDSVFREMREPGITGDKMARQTADIFSRYLEDSRTRANAAGANIGKIDNYTPQSHDSIRMLQVGQKAYVEKTYGLIDWDTTLTHLDSEAARKEVLEHIYKARVTGYTEIVPNLEQAAGSSFKAPKNIASGLEHHRVLNFKDADSALEYNKAFGKGNVVDAVISHLEIAARKISLMEQFGPNPEAAIRVALDSKKKSLKSATPDMLEKMLDAKGKEKLSAIDAQIQKAKTPDEMARLSAQRESLLDTAQTEQMKKLDALWKGSAGSREGKLGKYFAEIAGETMGAANPTAARIASGIRMTENSIKLGGAFLSAFADVFMKAVSLRHNGENLFESWRRSFDMRIKRLQKPEMIELGNALGVYADSLIRDIQLRYDVGADGFRGTAAKMSDFMFKASGLDAWTEGHKAAYTFYLSNKVGSNFEKAFNDLNPDFAANLRRHRLDEKWEILQMMSKKEDDGRMYCLPDNAFLVDNAMYENFIPERFREENIPEKPELLEAWKANREKAFHRAKQDLQTDLMGYFADETKYAVLEPDDKARALMYQGTRPGTPLGELMRFSMQFKSFPVTYGQRILAESRWAKASRAKGVFTDVPGFVNMAIGATLFGYVAMTAKDLSKGKTPKDPGKLETWFAAAMQSGGLGLLGDFFLGKVDRFGNQAASTIVGPVLSDVASLAPAGGLLIRGDVPGATEEAVRFGTNNIPFANLWYARQAVDYMFLHHVRETMSPGTLQRTKTKMMKDYGQEYWLDPTDYIKRGGGFKK